MGEYVYDYAVIGGDMRQVYLAGMLCGAGYRVITYGLCEIESAAGRNLPGAAEALKCQRASSIFEAVEQARSVAAPIPFSVQGNYAPVGGYLRSNCPEIKVAADDILAMLRPGQMIFAGCFTTDQAAYLQGRDIAYADFMEDEATTIYNTIATAEGVLAETIKEYPGNLHKSRALIIGFGRCARTLAHKLAGLAVHVTVTARNPEQLEWASAYGYDTRPLPEAGERLEDFLLIYNTIPYLYFDRRHLKLLHKEAMIFDIASAPGGVDFKEAAKRGIFARLYPGLPGIYAPRASAAVLMRFMEKVNKE